jgi:hypothetical protein
MGNTNDPKIKKKSKDDYSYEHKENFVANDLDKNFSRSFTRQFTNPNLINNSKKNFENLKVQYENNNIKNNHTNKNLNINENTDIKKDNNINSTSTNINENFDPSTKENNQNFNNNINNNNNYNNTELNTDSKLSSLSNSKNNIEDNIKKVFIIPKIEYEKTDEKLKYKNTVTSSNQNEFELQTFYRNEKELRSSYIEKLIVKGIMSPKEKENQKSHNSLIIFDWDDTLLPTSFLTKNGVYNENLVLSNTDQEKIKKLENNVYNILYKAIDKGDVFIITNAGPGWVEYSAEKYYPKIVDLLNKIHIISARGEYESKFPNDSKMWKTQAFLNVQKNFDDIVTNIICLGDSIIEMEAGRSLAEKFSEAFIKTIKFRESPKPEELNKQLTLVLDQFQNIYTTIKNLTIRVEKRKGKKDK